MIGIDRRTKTSPEGPYSAALGIVPNKTDGEAMTNRALIVHPIVKSLKGSLIEDVFPPGPLLVDDFDERRLIEERASQTQSAGEQPLWEGYRSVRRGERPAWGSGKRSSNQVRTRSETGACYYRLMRALKPQVMVEIGTAFGVSGMFWLSGIEANGAGCLFTFDPNAVWRDLALENLSKISSRFVSTQGTFEEKFESVLPVDVPIDGAFIDGIHTAEFVYPQVELIKGRLRTGGVLVLDDIRFAPDMLECWQDLSTRSDVVASLELGRRVGVIEYTGSSSRIHPKD